VWCRKSKSEEERSCTGGEIVFRIEGVRCRFKGFIEPDICGMCVACVVFVACLWRGCGICGAGSRENRDSLRVS